MTRVERIHVLVASIGLLGFQLAASAFGAQSVEQFMQDGILISVKEPSLAISVEDSLTFVGRHPIAIGEVSAGERFVFIEADGESVRRLFIVQFEGFLPAVDDYFRYNLSGRPVVAKYPFRSNGYAFDMVEQIATNPTGESASTNAFLRSKGYSAPDLWMMWRSLTVPDQARKKEVILFYVEDLESIGLTLADLYKNDSETQEWINIQEKLAVRANSSFQLAELDDNGQPINSTWSSMPSPLMR